MQRVLLLSHVPLRSLSHVLCCAVLRALHFTPFHTDMPELMGASMFNNLDPAQLAQLQKMAAQVGGSALGVPAIA